MDSPLLMGVSRLRRRLIAHHCASQPSTDELGFALRGLGTRDLRDHLSPRGDPNVLTAPRALEIGRQILPKVRNVHVGHGVRYFCT